MPCFSPLPATRGTVDTSKVFVGKRGTRFSSFVIPSTGELIEPFNVPCGRCVGCRIDKANQWALRLMCESKYWSFNSPCRQWFITLTYDEDHLPRNSKGLATLRKKDVQDFLKRLRFHFQEPGYPIRYMISGEYGSKTYRPHYHMIAINLPLFELVPYSRNFEGDYLFTSSELDSVWSMGSCKIGALTYNSCAYTARYTIKKLLTAKDAPLAYDAADLEPEFMTCSRRPGIGFPFLSGQFEHFKIRPSILIPPSGDFSKVRNMPLPPYFLSKMAEIDPLAVAKIKSARSELREKSESTHSVLSGLTIDEYVKVLEDSFSQRISTLSRKL